MGGAAQVVVRKAPRLVAPRFDGALEQRGRLIVVVLFDEVGADIVVRVAKIGVGVDGALACGDGIFDAPLEMIGPAQKRVSFRGGMQFERRLIELNGAIVVAFHLRLVGVLQDFPGPREGFHAHKPHSYTWFGKRQKYESSERAWWEPVLRTGDESGNSITKRIKYNSSN